MSLPAGYVLDQSASVATPPAGYELDQPSAQTSQPMDWKKAASDYLLHPAIEGSAMALGGAAGATVGAAGGPVGVGLGGIGGAAAMYPPAHQFANAIDQYIGVDRPQTYAGSVPQQLGQGAKDFQTGLDIEATSAALKPAMGLVGKILPGAKTGEVLSGTPASNLRRAYNQGFAETYINPKPLAQASADYGTESNKVLSGYLSPEKQAAMMVSPTGQANQQISDVYAKWLKGGEEITPQEAVATKQAISTVFPNNTAKNASKIARLTDFEKNLDSIISNVAPDFKAANDNYAASKLRSQLMMPARVNTSNPNQYSKLGAMLEGLVLGGGGMAHALPVGAGIIGTSPLAMGIASSTAGSVSRAASKLLDNSAISKAVADLIARYYPNSTGQQQNQR